MRSTIRHALSFPVAAAIVFVASGCQDDPISQPGRAADPMLAMATDGGFVPGTSYFGDNNYVEYIAGNMPVIFSAPHGGTVAPSAIPLRTATSCGLEPTTVTDVNTQDLVRRIQQAFYSRTGKYPHIIINRLNRNRMDANRPIEEAACGDPLAEEAWRDFQGFIDAAKAQVLATEGRGWYTDVHGHGHSIQRLELGYELTGTTLRRTDASLDGSTTVEAAASFRTFSEQSPLSFSQVLRGPTSLGTLFANAGYPSVPSQQDPAPDVGESYFNGGYNTDRHACSNGGQICGVQIEAHSAGVRDTELNRRTFAARLVDVYTEYLAQFGVMLGAPRLPADGETIIVDNDNSANDAAWGRFISASSWVNGLNSASWGGTDFRLESAPSPTDGDAQFLFYVGTPGTYSVEAWWPAQSTRSRNASFQLFDAAGTELAALKRDQTINGARWNALGTYTFAQRGWARVVISRALSCANPADTSTCAGSLAADAIRVTYANRAPLAQFALPASPTEGQSVVFDGASSADPDGDALTYAWTFGDGATSSDLSPTHTFADDGSFAVTLTVTDRHGATGTMTQSLIVRNVAPMVASFDGATIMKGETYTAHGIFSDPGADSWTATVDHGDDSGTQALALAGKSFALAHRYALAGTFTTTVTVHDGDDAGTGSATVTVLTPAQAAGVLGGMVRALGAGGALHAGLVNSLGVKLEAAAKQLERGGMTAAEGQIGAFINEVEALVNSGRLPASDGAALMAYAQRVLASMLVE